MRGRRYGFGHGHRGRAIKSQSMDIQELLDAARAGSQRAAGRLLSLVESERRDEVLAMLPESANAIPALEGWI